MQLIQVNSSTINNEVKQTVNARELHGFLGSKRKFTDWMKERIELYDFLEGQDYVIHKIVTQYNQIDRVDYAISIDMAKEICMVERNEKGKQARQYFIECERMANRRPDPMEMLKDPGAMRHLLLIYSEKVISQEKVIDDLSPRAAVADRLAGADGLLSIRDAAKSLKMKEKSFVLWLIENNWMYRDQKYRLRGYSDKTPKYIDHKVTPIPTIDDADKVSLQAMITPAGLTRLADIFNVEAEVYQEAA